MIFLWVLFTTLVWGNCEYSYSVWNTQLKKAEGPFTVRKAMSELRPEEKGPFGCTPCESDQVEITLTQGQKVKLCRHIAVMMEKNLNEILASGFKITSLVGYRPSFSKGVADAQGRRSQLSHHAFGAAVDINEEFNGLYDQCLEWGPRCRLIKGGAYRPGHPQSIIRESAPVKIMQATKFQWGGAISGVQKDFMHFSSDGY